MRKKEAAAAAVAEALCAEPETQAPAPKQRKARRRKPAPRAASPVVAPSSDSDPGSETSGAASGEMAAAVDRARHFHQHELPALQARARAASLADDATPWSTVERRRRGAAARARRAAGTTAAKTAARRQRALRGALPRGAGARAAGRAPAPAVRGPEPVAARGRPRHPRRVHAAGDRRAHRGRGADAVGCFFCVISVCCSRTRKRLHISHSRVISRPKRAVLTQSKVTSTRFRVATCFTM